MALLDPIFFYANYALIYTILLIVAEKDLDAELAGEKALIDKAADEEEAEA